MHVLATILLASFLSQGSTQEPPKRLPPKSGRITLPPAAVTPKPQERQRVRNDAGQFHRDVIDLRRSKSLKPHVEELILQRLRANYDDPALLAINLAARCKNDLLYGLMKVVDRYGDKYHAEQLHFQVLTRPMGRVTETVVATVVAKSGDRAKDYLFDYLQAKHAPVRKVAGDMLPAYLTEADLPRLLQLSRNRKTDVRRKIVELLGGIDAPKARERLLHILTQDPPVAADACAAAIRQGAGIAPELAKIVSRPARGRAFGYAAFALARIEQTSGTRLLTADMVQPLRHELGGSDLFLRSTSAIALAAMAYRSGDLPVQNAADVNAKDVAKDVAKDDAKVDQMIVSGLLDLVAPDKFVTSLQMLKPTATELLVKFSGRSMDTRQSWRSWWSEARTDFVGLREKLELTAQNADRALLMWKAGDHELAFRGSDVPAESVPETAKQFILAGDQMLALIDQLRRQGFMTESELPLTPDTWNLDLRVDKARVVQRIEPTKGREYHDCVAQVVKGEMWQQHRDPVEQPDANAFWRMERRWLAKHPGEEAKRLVWHILRRLPTLDGAARDAALTDLQSIPGLPKLITDDDANVLIKVASGLEDLAKGDFRLLEVALLAPGDTIWKKVLGVLEGRIKGAGDEIATRVFRLLGPERVVTAIRHHNRHIAMAAMHDAAANRNQAAIPVLTTRMNDVEGDVQSTAIYALGVLHAVPARDELLRLEPKAHPAVRREIWKALGRIGGPTVPGILKRAMEEPLLEDKLAALTAMGFTQNADLARFLATRYVMQAGEPDAFSQQAELSLRRIGPLLAIPALRPHLQMQEGLARQRLILLLGEFQDPRVVRDLIDLLRDQRYEAAATDFIEEITGVDLRTVNDRVRVMYAWYADNRNRGQAQWYLDALRIAQVATTLEAPHLTPRAGVGAVEELAQLLTKLREQRLRVLTATMLRETTGKDFTRGVRNANDAALIAIADRYRVYAATVRAAAK